jgi:glycosyltransferase involved in cell wall biosynthesis
VPRVLHIVTTAGFAGVERYVCDVAGATASRGWGVTVVGGERKRMLAALDGAARWEPGATLAESLRSIRRLGRFDVCNAHMTAAEAVAVAGRPLHRAPIIATRHFAARRGASLAGRFGAPWIRGRIAREIAVGEFIAANLERQPTAVIPSGVRPSPGLWRTDSRVVLMLQRLEREKDTLTGVRAWQLSGLADYGWSLRICGEGSQRGDLERWVAAEGVKDVSFDGWTDDVPGALAGAGMLLATATAEPLGLSVLDAMAAGVPVVASGAGGHLETVGRVAGASLFPPGDAEQASGLLSALRSDHERARLSTAEREFMASHFTLDHHVELLLAQYEELLAEPTPGSESVFARRTA